jgi:pimeloyl-ACP methyl ester carboxylesterase
VLLALVCLVFGGGSYAFAWDFTRAGKSPVGSPPAELGASDVSLKTSDGLELSGWFSPPARAGGSAVLLLHGYRGSRLQMLARARWLQALGYGVLLYDARGCGQSQGSMRSFGYYETRDVVAALSYVRQHTSGKIFAIGVSQGGATLMLAADRLQGLSGVVCESVYDELSQAVDRRYRTTLGIPGWLGGVLMIPMAEHRLGLTLAQVRPIACVAELPCPLLMLAGDHDLRTWKGDTERLFAAAHAPKRLSMFVGAGHEDLFGYAPRQYEEQVLPLLATGILSKETPHE